MSRSKFSPVDAARLAAMSAPRALSVHQEVVVWRAAVLWCRELAFPTARSLAADIGRWPSTVLHGFGHMVEIQAEVIRGERAALAALDHDDPTTLAENLGVHAATLAAVDPVLVRLPCLVLCALAETDVEPVSRAVWRAVHVMASFVVCRDAALVAECLAAALEPGSEQRRLRRDDRRATA